MSNRRDRYRLGAYFLTGYCTPFHQLPVRTRAKVLQSWRTARLSFLPIVAKSMQAIAQKSFFQSNRRLFELAGYSDTPPGYKPGDGYDFQFMKFAAGTEPEVIETDVIIVGSGPGGAVCAKAVAEAGHRVIVVDKGYYFPPSQLPMTQAGASDYLFEGQCGFSSEDSSANVVSGSCWGGGGTINWSVSLETQQFVREEWASEGLPFFTSPQFQECLDKVSDTMGVSDKYIRHNPGNRVVIDGAAKLGWKAAAAPQNTGGNEHYCGRCHLGCGSNEKKGPVASYLPAAARAGATFVEGFRVDRVLFDESSGEKKATGVVGKWVARNAEGGVDGPLEERVTREVVVKAAKVIVSCGSLWTPVVLKKSGLDVSSRDNGEVQLLTSAEPPNRSESAYPPGEPCNGAVQRRLPAVGG